MVEATEFPQLSNRYFVSAVPKVVINEGVDFEGALPEKSYLDKVLEAEGMTKRADGKSFASKHGLVVGSIGAELSLTSLACPTASAILAPSRSAFQR